MVSSKLFQSFFFLLPLVALFISGCSTKEVFTPKKVQAPWTQHAAMSQEIVDITSNAALLENRKVLSKTQELNISIPQNQRLVSISNEWVISASIDGNVTLSSINNAKEHKVFTLKKTIASASVYENMLAVLFANNVMALYDLETHEILFREDGGKSIAVNARIQAPYFMPGLVIFPTLDGKIVIVNTQLKKRLRTVIVSSEDFFNNIIFFDKVNNKLLSASGYKLLSLSQKEIRQKYEIRNMVHDGTNVYITTKQGEVIAFDSSLNLLSKVKFPFAHFLGMIYKDGKLYILEKEGYMIVVDAESFDYTVHPLDLDEGFVFVGKDMFYVDDEKIFLNN